MPSGGIGIMLASRQGPPRPAAHTCVVGVLYVWGASSCGDGMGQEGLKLVLAPGDLEGRNTGREAIHGKELVVIFMQFSK